MAIRETRLANGLRIISEARQHVETVAVGVWIGVGSRSESLAQNGLTHFLEHMVFKGTDRRSARAIATEIETVGGHLNAYTTRDYTTFYARVLKDDLSLGLDLLSDILLNSRFDPKEIQREKEVVLQEIGQSIDTPDDIIFDHMQQCCFANQALGRPILGSTENVNSFDRDALTQYTGQHYSAGNMVIAAAGKLDHDILVAEVEKYFAGLPAGTSQQFDPAVFTGGKVEDNRDLEQVHVTMAWPGSSFHDDDYYALQVYSMLLGGGMSSRLFQEVRENRGLAYSVYSFANSHSDAGLLGIYAGSAPEMRSEMQKVIIGEMEKLTANVSEEEIQIAKSQLKAGLLMALEATSSRIEQIGRQLLVFDRTIPTEETIKGIDAVDPTAFHKIAQKFVGNTATAEALVGKII